MAAERERERERGKGKRGEVSRRERRGRRRLNAFCGYPVARGIHGKGRRESRAALLSCTRLGGDDTRHTR